MTFLRNDGGRAEAGFKGEAGDCVCRAIAIAAGLPYRRVYDDLARSARAEPKRTRGGRSSPRTGVWRKTYEKYLIDLGFRWVPTMKIGSGCTVHLKADELPGGRVIVRVTRHVAAVIDGILHDTHDSSRGGTRCVYGYYVRD